jgi:AcrR family transcriptional regulator
MTAEMTRLRVDARENRDRILAAASELFAERGLDVGMRDVARRAGVGPATLYRRFPTRQALIDEALAAEFDACRRIVEDACAEQDAWRGFSVALRRLVVLNTRNRGLVDALVSTVPPSALAEHRRDLLQQLAGVARRAQEDGDLRPDFVPSDLLLVLSAARGVSAPAPQREHAATRFAELALDALRAHPAPAASSGE